MSLIPFPNNRNRRLGLYLGLLVLALVGRVALSDSDAKPTRTVKHVVDGDTVTLSDGERVRLLAIDTPERGEPLYKEAGTYLSNLVKGREVSLEFGPRRRDSYHRLLAHLWLGDSLISLEMLASGYARYYPWQDDSLYRNRLLSAQTAARKAKAGVWGLPAPAPESVYVIHQEHLRFHRPSCHSVRSQYSRTEDSRDELLDAGFAACRTCKP
jgi:endonuclease YncB( thermonuclease family)